MTKRRVERQAEDEALWRLVTRSVKPLKQRPTRKPPRAEPISPADLPPPARPKTPPKTRSQTERSAPQPTPPPLAPIEKRARRKLARGSTAIDARIDLHGMTQTQAHAALLRFIRRAQADHARYVLVITGRGARAGAHGGGILKRQVPLWLSLPEFRAHVVGVEDAHISHGGAGALYVRLRRA